MLAEPAYVHLPHVVLPEIDHRQAAGNGRAVAAEDFDGLAGLDRRDQAHDRAQDAGHVAGGRAAGRGALGHQAAEASGFAGQDGHRLPFGPHAAAVDPRQPELHRRVVDQEPRLEIVGPVEDHVDAIAKPFDVRRIDVGHHRLDGHGGIDPSQFFGRGHGLRQAGLGVGLVEQRLPLKITQLDEVAVDDSQRSHAGPDQDIGDCAAQRPAAAQQRPRPGQPPLSFLAQRRETHLAGVAGKIKRQCRITSHRKHLGIITPRRHGGHGGK